MNSQTAAFDTRTAWDAYHQNKTLAALDAGEFLEWIAVHEIPEKIEITETERLGVYIFTLRKGGRTEGEHQLTRRTTVGTL